MNMEHVKALAKIATYHNLHATHNGVEIWSEGHIMIPAVVDGSKEKQDVATLWDQLSKRENEEPMELGTLWQHKKYAYRELKSSLLRVLIDEAYRRTVQDDHGIRIYAGSDQNKPVTFRRDGELVGIVMPVRYEEANGLTELPEDTSDEKVFSHLAREENDWYLQGPEELRRRLREALAE